MISADNSQHPQCSSHLKNGFWRTIVLLDKFCIDFIGALKFLPHSQSICYSDKRPQIEDDDKVVETRHCFPSHTGSWH